MRVTRKSHLFFSFASDLSVVVVTVATTVIIIIKIKKCPFNSVVTQLSKEGWQITRNTERLSPPLY